MTTHSQSRDTGVNNNLPISENLVKTSPTKGIGSLENLSVQLEQKRTEKDVSTVERGSGNTPELSLGHFSVNDPNFITAVDISEYFQQNFKIHNLRKMQNPVFQKHTNKLEAFYDLFINVAEYLNTDQLFKACVFEKGY